MINTDFYNQVGERFIVDTVGGHLEITLTEDSGRVVTRKKIKNLLGTEHPGIIMGKNYYGELLINHLHEDNVFPGIVTFTEYAKGQNVRYDNTRPVAFDKITIVNRAIAEWDKRKEYNKVNYNCQTYVNLIVNGASKSETVEKIVGSLAVTALIFGVVALMKK
jgi:hypothetical protein